MERRSSFVALLARITALGLASVAAGAVVGGIGGRIMMRISAVAAPDFVQGARTEGGNLVGTISVDGSIALLIFGGILAGILGACVLVIVDPWVGRIPRQIRGAVVGLYMFAIGGIVAIAADNIDFIIVKHKLLNVAMLAALFPIYGYVAVWLSERIDRRLQKAKWSRPQRVAALALIVFGGLQSVAGVMGSAFGLGTDFVDTAPPIIILGGLALVGLATLLEWRSDLSRTPAPRSAAWIAVVGSVLVLGPGLWFMGDQITKIL
jgi:hypothetical protein